MALFVYDKAGAFVAQVNKQHKAADGYAAALPWLLLHNTGGARRYGTQAEAKDEAQKVYPGCTFRRT